MMLSPAQRILRAFIAWAVVVLFAFPIYYWATVSIKVERDIFSRPPKVFDFTLSAKSYEEVFGVSFGFEQGLAVLPGGGDFYMTPRLVDSIVIALFSTILAVAVATLAAYALSRMRFRGQHHFVFWILSTRMMPPVAVVIPMFFIYKDFGLLDTYTGVILMHALMNMPLANVTEL